MLILYIVTIMSLSFLENIPDLIVRNDLVHYFQCKCKNELLNYKHIFNKIGEGNIFYPDCYLYANKEEINLYSGYCNNGYYNKLIYNIKEQQYIFIYEEKNIFNAKLWAEMNEYIHNYFYFYIYVN